MSRQVFSLRHTKHAPSELLLPLWEGRASLSAAQVPYTAGGRRYPVKRAAAIEVPHMEQKDTRLNAALWGVSPAQYFSADREERITRLGELMPLVQSYERAIETIHDAAITRNTPLPAMAGEAFENLRLRRNAATLSLLSDTLDMLGFLASPAASDADTDPEKLKWEIRENQATRGWESVDQNKAVGVEFYSPDRRTSGVRPLADVVGRVTRDTALIDKLQANGEYILAAREAHRSIQNLYPWPASPLVFTPDQAFGTGIAQLESDLWARTAHSLLHAGRVTGYAGFYDSALSCAEALTNMRYVTRGALSKAWFVFYEVLGRKHTETSQPLNTYPSLMAVDAVVAKTAFLFGHAIVQHAAAAQKGHVHSEACGHDHAPDQGGHVHTDACGHDHVHTDACGHGQGHNHHAVDGHVHTDACNHDHDLHEHVHTDACNHGTTPAHDHIPATFNPSEWAHELCDEEHICAEGGSEAAEMIADTEGVYVSAPNGVEGEVELHGGYAVNDA